MSDEDNQELPGQLKKTTIPVAIFSVIYSFLEEEKILGQNKAKILQDLLILCNIFIEPKFI